MLQDDSFSHAALYRRACRVHERKLRSAVEAAVAAVSEPQRRCSAPAKDCSKRASRRSPTRRRALFWPTSRASSQRFPTSTRPRRTARRSSRTARRLRVAILADGIGSMHGVTRTISEIRERGVPGFEIEVLGTDPEVDRRLPAVARSTCRSTPACASACRASPRPCRRSSTAAYDAVHVCAPGPAGVAGALLARALGLPLLGSYHTDLGAYAAARAGERHIAEAMTLAVGTFYRACDVVLSPSPAADAALAAIGVAQERVMRWDRGIDLERFSPRHRRERAAGHRARALRRAHHAREGRRPARRRVRARARARPASAPRARRRRTRGGALARRLGDTASFLGWLDGAELADAYANASCSCSPARPTRSAR